MIRIKQTGNFKRTDKFLKALGDGDYLKGFETLGEAGVAALYRETPKDTGKTAASWGYRIEKSDGGLSIYWTNTNVQDGVNIAMIIQYGHGTKSGVYVAGVDYINPALGPIFDAIAKKAWEEVTRNA